MRLRLTAPLYPRDAQRSGPRGLAEAMEARVALEERIARQFVRDGSFLDVDVVDSYHLKLAEERPERVVVSFERFRALIEGIVDESGGQVLNSNGDEVMAFFPGADAALAGGARDPRAAPGLERASTTSCRDPSRCASASTAGARAVDLERGVAYSPVLDGAGHLQKAAPVGGLLLSKETWLALSSREGLAPKGALGKGGLEAYGPAEGPR